MNKHRYRVLFSKTLQRFIVTSELAKMTTAGNTERDYLKCGQSSACFSFYPSLQSLTFAVFCALGFVSLVSPSAYAETLMIQADSTAAANQHPVVLQTANGLPQVNIQTPNAQGLSHNRYSHFDIDTQGAILNNSRKNTQTQQGGWIQGNPYLAGGEAKVILNEVNSNHPSQLKGYVEVAGRKADVIIANPNGIHCQGCGIMNAERATFTTGKPEIHHGSLDSFKVEKGKVTVEGKGLDNSQTDYTDIISRSAEINAGIWSKREVNVTTGKNRVTKNNDSMQIIHTTEKEKQSENPPHFALDVTHLGGMYAEKIHLIGTEQGLGVNHAGHIGASAGEVVIDAKGHVVNQGFIGAQGNIQLQSSENIENRGTIHTKEKQHLKSKNLDNRQGTLAGKQIQIDAAHVDNRKVSEEGSLIVATNNILVQANTLDNRGTKNTTNPTQGIQAAQVTLTAQQINNQSGGIYATQRGTLNVTSTLDNRQGDILSAEQLDIYGDKSHANMNNAEGKIHAGKHVTLTAKTLQNEGNISTTGNADIALTDGIELNNAFQVNGDLRFTTEGKFTNKSKLNIGHRVNIHATEIENTQAAEISSKTTQISTALFTNRGLIDGETTRIEGESLNNIGTGRIYGDQLSFAATHLTNAKEGGSSATIAARKRLDFGINTLKNLDQSFIFSLGDLHIGGTLSENGEAVGRAKEIINGSGIIEAMGDGKINTTTLLNTDLHLKLGINESREYFHQVAKTTDSQRFTVDKDGIFAWNKKRSEAWFQFYDGRPTQYQNDWIGWRYNRTTKTSKIDVQTPGKILIGGHLTLIGDHLKNQYSKLLVGKSLILGEQSITQNLSHQTLSEGSATLINEDVIGNIDRLDKGSVFKWVHYRSRGLKKSHGHKDTDHKHYEVAHPTEHFNFNVVKNHIGDPEAVRKESDNTSVAAHTPANVISPVENTLRLPNQSLYKINPHADSHYIVETDPRFADKRQWLSSDYMFHALRADPQNMLKRLGDGFYEQRLINEQINQLTGRRFLEGYTSDYEQYKALMDNGLYYAKKWNLTPGVALTAAQMKELTSDLVWFEKRETQLPNGEKINVLAPKVYLSRRNSKINGEGSLISAHQVIIRGMNQVDNSGTILGNSSLSITAQNIKNNEGRLQANHLSLSAENELLNLGGTFEAKDNLAAHAKNLRFESKLSETKDTGDFYKKDISKAAELNLTDKNGKLQVHADENIVVKGIRANIAGDAAFYAKGDLELGTVSRINKEHYRMNADNYYLLDQENQIGNQIQVKGNAQYIAGQNITVTGNQLHSDAETTIAAQGNIDIHEGRVKEHLNSAIKTTDRGLVSKKTITAKHRHDYDLAEASMIDADKIHLQSNNGNIKVQGSNLVAENGFTAQGKNIDIREAENRVYSEDFYSKKKSGMLGGGIGVTFGSQKQTLETDQTRLYASGSQVGSLNHDTRFIAENRYTQTASAVSSAKGNVDILAQQATIKAADDKYESNMKQTFEQKGLTIAITSPILSALQAVQSTIKSAQQTGNSKNNRINAMSAVNTGFDAYRAGQAVGQAQNALSNVMNGSEGMDSMVGIQITYGQQKSESKTHTEGKTAATAQVNAGGKVNIVATGAGKASNITINGSDVSGKQGTFLGADNDINITAAEQTHKERSTNKSSGFNVGVAVKFGNGVAAGITVGGNRGKGYGNSDETSYVASHVGDANSQTTIQSGGDTNLIGSQVKGKRVEVNAENLNIKSLQDKSSYDGKQTNVSGSVTVGYGFAAGGSFSKSKINADHASVNEQAGIYAGDDGYDVNVEKHSNLKGALVTSTQTAENEGKNRFSTGTITHSDIENYSNHNAKGFGVGGSVTIGGGNAPKEIGGVELQKIGKNNADGSGKVETGGIAGIGSQGNWGLAKGLITGLLGQVSDKGSEHGVTTSSINTKNLIIRDKEAQEQLTGKSINETIKALNQENRHQKLAKADIESIKSDLERNLSVATKFMENVNSVGDEIYYQMEKNEDSVFSIQKKTENCNHINCLDFETDNSQALKRIIYSNDLLTDEQAQLLSKVATAGMLNLKREDKVSSAILYDKDLSSIDETAVILNRGSTNYLNEFIFTGFERFRAWANLPSVFGASNATRDHAQITKKLNEYNAHRIAQGKEAISANNVAHSLGVSGNKNMLNWSEYVGNRYDNTKVNFLHLGGSYPSEGVDKQAKQLFGSVNTEYHGVKGDVVYSGLGGLFIGNNPNAKQVEGLSFGQAHSEANQNINNLKYIYKLRDKDDKWIKTEEIIKNIYPLDFNRKFNSFDKE